MNTENNHFPNLDDCAETLNSIHGYSKLLGAIRGNFSPPHPKWWHVSLKLYTSGLTTANIPHPQLKEKYFSLSLDLRNHYFLFSPSNGKVSQINLTDAIPILDLEKQIKFMMATDHIHDDFDNSKYASHRIISYSIDHAEKYFSAITQIQNVFETIYQSLPKEKNPVQLWPHHFDLAFEKFGNLSIDYQENGEKKSAPAQIGIGFVPHNNDDIGQAYIYVNPFPFDESIMKTELPANGYWYQENWKGAVLPYNGITNSKRGAELLTDFLNAAINSQMRLIEA